MYIHADIAIVKTFARSRTLPSVWADVQSVARGCGSSRGSSADATADERRRFGPLVGPWRAPGQFPGNHLPSSNL